MPTRWETHVRAGPSAVGVVVLRRKYLPDAGFLYQVCVCARARSCAMCARAFAGRAGACASLFPRDSSQIGIVHTRARSPPCKHIA